MTELEQCRYLATEEYANISEKIISGEINIKFIRGQDQLAIYKGKGTGRILLANEAREIFPRSVFQEIVDYGTAIISTRDEPWKSINERLTFFRTKENFLYNTLQDNSTIEKLKAKDFILPIRTLETLYRNLGMDERFVNRPYPSPTKVIPTYQPKKINNFECANDNFTAITLKASWINKTQKRLLEALDIKPKLPMPETENIPTGEIPYRSGYNLADKTRKLLGYNIASSPVLNLQRICEEIFGIVCITCPLDESYSGVALNLDGDRFIVINSRGYNDKKYTRRLTIAHELCHILWDVPDKYAALPVDMYDNNTGYSRRRSSLDDSLRDEIEARARAFSVNFLLPRTAFKDMPRENYSETINNLSKKYGIPYRAAQYHLYNYYNDPTIRDINSYADGGEDWDDEDMYYDIFPIEEVPLELRGRFARVVAEAEDKAIISTDTAATYLNISVVDYEYHKAKLLLPQLNTLH